MQLMTRCEVAEEKVGHLEREIEYRIQPEPDETASHLDRTEDMDNISGAQYTTDLAGSSDGSTVDESEIANTPVVVQTKSSIFWRSISTIASRMSQL